MALLLVRHGSTSWNQDTPGLERLRGWADVPLATEGLLAARRAARALAGRSIARIFTSDLKRAYDTARIMSVTLGAGVDPVRDLRPWHVGDFSGMVVDQVAEKLRAFTNGQRAAAPPNGESFNAFLARWRMFLKKLLKLAAKTEGDIVAVTHARNLYALQELLFGDDIPVKGPPNPCAVLLLHGDWGDVHMSTIHRGHTPGPLGGEGS